MNRDEMLSILRSQAHQIRELQERLETMETRQEGFWVELQRTQEQVNRALQYLIQVIRERWV